MLSGIVTVGHPVDVASGAVYTTKTDVSVPGQIDLTWKRNYLSTLGSDASAIGRGWSVRYFSSLTINGDNYEFESPFGGRFTIHDDQRAVENGGLVRQLGMFQELSRDGNAYVLTRWNTNTLEVTKYIYESMVPGKRFLLSRIEDVGGGRLEIHRDARQRPVLIQQSPEGRELLVDYTSRDQIAQIALRVREGQPAVLSRFEYDPDGRLVAAFDARGNADRYEYDEASRLTREILKDGGVFSFVYDADGRCLRTAGLERYDEKSFRYLPRIGWTEVTDSHGATRRFEYLPSGQVITEVNPLGGRSRTVYDDQSRIIEKIDAAGASIQFTFGSTGDLASVTNSLGNTMKFQFNDSHQLVEFTNFSGSKWTREYDEANRLVVAKAPLGVVRRFEWSSAGRLRRVTNPRGDSIEFEYSDDGQVVRAKGYDGRTLVTRYHPQGLPLEIDDDGKRTQYAYDPNMNVTAVTEPDRRTCHLKYDAGNNVTQFVDFDGATTSRRYGPCSRTLEIHRADDLKVRFHWDTEPNRLLQIEVEDLGSYTYEYDLNGNVVGETGFDGKIIEHRYDIAEMRIAQVAADGTATQLERDTEGNIVSRISPDGSTAKYEYDQSNRLTRIHNGESEVVYEYDELGRVVSERQDDAEIRSEYDVGGLRVRRETSLDQFTEYAFDANMSLETLALDGRTILESHLTSPDTAIREFADAVHIREDYDVLGRVVEQWVGAKGEHSSHSTGGDQLSSIDSTTQVHRRYAYAASGNLAAMNDARWGQEEYRYDAGDRITSAIRDGGISESFEFDRFGRRTNVVFSGGGQDRVMAYRHGDANELVEAGESVLKYDVHGNLVTRTDKNDAGEQTWQYEWDGVGMLASVTNPEGATWRYYYDGLGRRTRKVGPSSEVRYIWDRDDVIHEVMDDRLRSWIHDPNSGSPLLQVEDDRVFVCITDHLGTPRELVDESGRAALATRYRTWGEVASETADELESPQRFPGQWHDEETGLHYNRFRYYAPGWGCFIARDPYRMGAGFLEYAYAPNPLMWIDFFGLDSVYVVRRPDGSVRYVGITNENHTDGTTLQRQSQHRQNPQRANWELEVIATDIDHDTARGVEQGLMDELGGPKSMKRPNQHLDNEINSMSPDRTKKYSSGETRESRLKKGRPLVDDFLEKEKKKNQDSDC